MESQHIVISCYLQDGLPDHAVCGRNVCLWTSLSATMAGWIKNVKMCILPSKREDSSEEALKLFFLFKI